MLMIDVGRYKNGDKEQAAGSNFITIENKMEKHSIKYKLNEECGEQETRDKCILFIESIGWSCSTLSRKLASKEMLQRY